MITQLPVTPSRLVVALMRRLFIAVSRDGTG